MNPGVADIFDLEPYLTSTATPPSPHLHLFASTSPSLRTTTSMDASAAKAILTSDNFAHASEISRATSPGGEPAAVNGGGEPKARVRPRTYPYFRYLPYKLEDESERDRTLHEILNQLYIAVEAGDFSPGAVHWTRELRGWLSLKFDPTRQERINLVKLYYELSLAPGIDPSTSERFASMFMLLTK
jgi:hypothetical protein